MDLDLAEKLKVPLKYEPQKMHWTNSEIIVPLWNIESYQRKNYHPYFSDDDKTQNYVFVSIALDEMLSEQKRY